MNELKIWIVGCGDIGRRVAAIIKHSNPKPPHAIVRSAHSAQLCQQQGVNAHQVDLDSPADLLPKSLFEQSNVFYFAPPPAEGKHDPRLQRFLEQMENAPNRFVLISTTGVYGDSQGEWIDESSLVKPTVERALRRLSAEQILQEWAQKYQKDFMILRVPGIYADDRLPLERLKKGLAVVNAEEAGWTNRIHADDLAQACCAAMFCNKANQIINICDGSPSTMTDYFNHVADYAGLPRPPQISMQQAQRTLSAGMVSYLQESRRIKNDKMLADLNITLKYPNLKTALPLPD